MTCAHQVRLHAGVTVECDKPPHPHGVHHGGGYRWWRAGDGPTYRAEPCRRECCQEPRPATPEPRPWVRKEDAPCCQAAALPDGRLPVGYCGPDCIRRPRTVPNQ